MASSYRQSICWCKRTIVLFATKRLNSHNLNHIKNSVQAESSFTIKTAQATKDAASYKNKQCYICTKNLRNYIGLHKKH